MEERFSLGDKVWFHPIGHLTGVPAIIFSKEGPLYQGTSKYMVKIEATGKTIENVTPGQLRSRS